MVFGIEVQGDLDVPSDSHDIGQEVFQVNYVYCTHKFKYGNLIHTL